MNVLPESSRPRRRGCLWRRSPPWKHRHYISTPPQGSPNRWEPVQFDRLPVKPVRPGSGLGRYQTGPNSKFKFEFQKMKNS